MLRYLQRASRGLGHAIARLWPSGAASGQKTQTAQESLIALHQEMQVARKVQAMFLPRRGLVLNSSSVTGRVASAREIGGDLIDYFALDDRHIAFVIGDVSGKGIPAALLMASAKAAIRGVAAAGMTPGATLARVNDVLAEENAEMYFVTMFYGILDSQSGLLRYANAGHPVPLLVDAERPISELFLGDDPALGIVGGHMYRDCQVQLETGNRLVGYTDGVPEARDESGQLYGESRLKELIGSRPIAANESLIGSLFDDVQAFQKGAGQADDIAAVVLQYGGRPEMGLNVWPCTAQRVIGQKRAYGGGEQRRTL
jgi:phosphoserine phosphatase RsbU/P